MTKFMPGDLVRLPSHALIRLATKQQDCFEIRKDLPEALGQRHYRIKSAHEPFERVIAEEEIAAVGEHRAG